MVMKTLADGTVASPTGFVAGAAICGLKESGNLDLAIVASDRDCTAAGVFTQNQVVAAPVVLSRETLAANNGRIRGVVVNAGNANACTGQPGVMAAREMQRSAADALNCVPAQVLVLSTGVIGKQLDLEKVRRGIATASADASARGGAAAARAIMTTDTLPKTVVVQVELPGGTVTLGGMAKGAGMIHPDMATLLGVLTTDAEVPAGELEALLAMAVDSSFNLISVDGDTSTNDTVLLLANGASGVMVAEPDAVAVFGRALIAVCVKLAQMIVRDGEGATKFVELVVTGGRVEAEARAIARTIASSPLVKTAFAGSDPNWGRILAAAGRAGVLLDQSRLGLWVSTGTVDGPKVQLVARGKSLEYLESDAARVFSQPEFQVHLDLGLGDGEATAWTCDLTHEYVSINADYRT